MSGTLPPGRQGIPFIGFTRAFLEDPLALLTQAYQRYGEVFYLSIFRIPNVFMIGSKATKFMLQDHPQWFSAREGNLVVAQKLFGNSILYMDGEEHKALRSTFMPAFRPNLLSQYMDIMMDVITWEAKGWILEKEIDIYQKAKRITLEIITRVFLGTSLTSNYALLQKNIDLLAQGLYADNTVDLPFTLFGKGRRARDLLYRKLDALVERHRSQHTQSLISLIVNSNNLSSITVTNKDVIDQLNTVLFAGHDTSSSTIAWTIWYLTQYPEVFLKIKEEFDQVLGTGSITYESVKKLTYLDCVLEEVLRLCPPVYFIPRMTTQDVAYERYTIPKGWLVNATPLISQRLPEVFSNPDQFDPDRFMPPREEHKRTPLSLISFGAGPKACIGFAFAQLQIKLFLIIVFRLYKLRAKDNQKLKSSWIPSLHPEKGPIVYIEVD